MGRAHEQHEQVETVWGNKESLYEIFNSSMTGHCFVGLPETKAGLTMCREMYYCCFWARKKRNYTALIEKSLHRARCC